MKILSIILTLLIVLAGKTAGADAVIFSGNDVKALKYNLDLFGRSKLMGLNVDPRAGAGVAAPLASIGMDYLTGEVYYKNGAANTDWISWSGSIEGTPNTFAAYDSTGILAEMPGWTYLNSTTNYETRIDPTIPTTLTDYYGMIDSPTLDDVAMNAYGSYVVDTVIGNANPTVVDNYSAIKNQTQFLADATITNLVSSFEDSNTTAAGAVVPNYNSVYIHPAFDHATMQNYRGVEVSPLVGNSSAHANTGQHSSFQSNTTFAANANMSNIMVFSAFDNFQAGAIFDDYYVLTSNSNINSAVAANSITGINTNFQVGNAAATTVGFYNGLSAALNVNAGSTVTNYNGVYVNPTFQTGSFTDFVTQVQIGGTYDVVAMNSLIGINYSAQVGTNSATTIANYTDMNLNPNLGANATLTDYRGINVRPNTAVGATVTNSITGIDVGSNAALPVGVSATGIQVDMANFTSPAQEVGVSIQNGALTVNSPVSTADAWFGTAASANSLGGQFSIVNGSPPAGGEFVFGNNLAVGLLADDDMPADGTGLGLGFGVVAFVGQGAVTAGHTVEDMNMALAGFGIPAPSTGGTLENAVMFKALGALPQGGTLNITNMFGFRAGPGLSIAGATNVWGISIEDPAAENYFNKSIAIDTVSKKVSNASVGFEIGGTTKALRLPILTTAEIAALTPLEGMLTYNDTTNVMNFYNGTTWTSTSGDVVGPASSVDSEIVLFDSTTGKLVKRATGSGFVKATSGVYSTAASVNLATEVTGTLPIANGGTGQTSQTPAFDALAPTTTKGDLIVHNGTDNIRVAVGTNDQFLVADSTQASGVRWSTGQARSEVWLYNGNGFGSTNTKIRRFSNVNSNTGSAITYTDSATNGASFTINEKGIYAITFNDYGTGTPQIGISQDSASLTTNIASIAATERVVFEHAPVANFVGGVSITAAFDAGVVLRPHTDGTATGTTFTAFRIIKVGSLP